MATDLRGQLQKLLGAVYTLERELGGGGMSRVFIGTESALGRKVVVKVLPPEVAAGVKVERFKREIQFLARLNHPHIVPMLAAGGAGGLFYYIMPFMEGETLRAHLLRRGQLPVGETLRTLRPVATALAFAHQNGIIHRDIKPDNVLLTGGSVMVTDFGVAKALSVSTGDGDPNALTSLGIALGTPSYIAPEQATADPTMDHRADIYSFGAMAYEMVSGRLPFAGRSPQAMLAAHIGEQPVPLIERRPEIPAALNSIVMRCLEKKPGSRPESAEELVHLLDEVPISHESPLTPAGATDAYVPAEATTSRRSPTRSSDTGRWGLYLLIAAGLLAVAAAIAGARWALRADDNPPASGSTLSVTSPARRLEISLGAGRVSALS